MFSHRGKTPFKLQTKGLRFTVFFSALAFSLIGVIWSVYLESFLHNPSYVGFLASLFTIVGVLSYFFIIPLIEKTSKSKLYIIALTTYFISYLLFGLIPNLYLVIFLGLVISVMASLRITTFGLMVRNKTKNTSSLSTNEGAIYTFLNLAWIIGPLIAGYVSSLYGLNIIFIISAFFILITITIFKSFGIRDDKLTKNIDGNILKVFKDFFSDKQRVICYILGSGVSFWWAFMYIYMPMRIIDLGLGEKVLGYFFFAIIIPPVISEYYFSNVCSRVGFKKFFIIAYSIFAAICLACFFVTNIYLLFGLLIFASFPISMVEPTTEAYFFHIVKKSQQDRFYGPYNTTVNTGTYFATFISAIILLHFSFNYLFLFFTAIMLFQLFISSKLKNIVEKRRN